MTREERLQLYKDIAFDIADAAHQLGHYGIWTEQAKVLLSLASALKNLKQRKHSYTSSHGGRAIRDQEEKWRAK